MAAGEAAGLRVPAMGGGKKTRGRLAGMCGNACTVTSWQAWGCVFEQPSLPPPGLKGVCVLGCSCTCCVCVPGLPARITGGFVWVCTRVL